MPRDHHQERRAAAERRVREMQARRTAGLLAWQEDERRKDFRAQKQALDRLAQGEAALMEQRRLTLERLDREWQQMRDKLGQTPGRAPAFGFAAPPPRDIRKEYDVARARYLACRDQVSERFDERLTACRRERADKLRAFQSANDARERSFDQARATLTEEQSRSFERLVRREMDRGQKSIGEEFARKSRRPRGHDRG